MNVEMSTPPSTTDPGAVSHRLEAAGLLLVLVALALNLVTADSIIAYSDPGHWFSFARHFTERFGESRLAYGFPLVAAAAIRLVGVVNGFFVNVPILLGLIVLVYVLTRSQVPLRLTRPAWIAPFGAAVAILLLFHLDKDMLGLLANPYRDPLSHALVLLAFWLLVRYREGPTRSLLRVAAAGLVFAYACSTREAAALMLLPLFVYATASRLEQPGLPYLKPLLVFGAAFVLGCIPLLVQNFMVSGNPLVPAQASRAFERGASLVPGARVSHLFETLPEVLEYLVSNLGAVGLTLLAVGIVAGVLTRHGGILYLLLPAIVVNTLFYGSYYRAVDRYLFTIDLYALPVAGVGAAALLQLLLRPIRRADVQRWIAAAAVAAAFLGAAQPMIRGAFPAGDRFRLAEANRLRQDFDRLLPDDARVIGEALIGEILECFLDREAFGLRMFRRNGALSPNLSERIRDLSEAPGPLYAVFSGAAFKHQLLSEFDLVPLVDLESARYALRGLVQQDFFHVREVRPWSSRETSISLRPQHRGEQLLVLDVRSLSRHPRSFARVRWGEEIIDEHPLDGRNYYRVSTDSVRGPVDVALTSDGPVPRVIRGYLLPPREKLRLDFASNDMMYLGGRFSKSFLSSGQSHPTIDDEGFVDVPTPGGRDAFFVFVADIEFRGRHAGYKQNLSIRAGDVPLYHATFVQSEDQRRRHNKFPSTALFWAGPPVVGVHNTRLHWKLDSRHAGGPAPLTLRSLSVHRHGLTKRMRIDLGSSRDETFVVDGFHPPESTVGRAPTRYRWTHERARLRVFTWPGGRPLRLSVDYLSGARPPGVPAADPRFSFNGNQLAGSSRRVPAGEFERVILSFDLPAAWVEKGMNRLEIHSRTWTPAQASDDRGERPHGIMLDAVTIEPAPG